MPRQPDKTPPGPPIEAGQLLIAYAREADSWEDVALEPEETALKLVGALVRGGFIEAREGASFAITAKGAAWLRSQAIDPPAENVTTNARGYVTHIEGRRIV